jgi:dihydroorotate dehydrogenase (NAD+) catalytic subunit
MTDLSVDIGNLKLKNPVMVASGTFGYAEEFKDFFDLNKLGAVVTKTITPEPRPGNKPPRIVETVGGMLNSIGLPNVGVDNFIIEKMPFLQTLNTKRIINVAGKTGDDFVKAVETLESVPAIDGYELNYSCPNVKEGGLSFSADTKIAQKVTENVRRITDRPLIVKLTPNVTSIGDIGKAVQAGGADAISAINTLVGMAVNLYTKKPRLSTVTGGLSGQAIKPIALAKVYELVQNVSIPIVAIGGISNANDALEFLLVGAKAVQVGTANFMNPKAPLDVLVGIEKYCQKNKLVSISDFIGRLKI